MGVDVRLYMFASDREAELSHNLGLAEPFTVIKIEWRRFLV